MKRILAVGLVAAATVLAQAPAQPPAPAVRTSGDSIGPYNKQIVDANLAGRGRSVYAVECVDCHGPAARGTETGPNLIRSLVVLRDRVGSELGPLMKKGHPLQSKGKSADLTADQITGLSHFLKQRIDDALKRQPMGDNINIITGNVAAGKAYFNGAGKCATSHAVSGTEKGSLFNISAKYPDPVNLQQAMLFPGGGRGGRGRGPAAPAGPAPNPVMLTVTPPGGQPITGELVMLDDFDIQLRDASGMVQSFVRTPAMKVVKTDPLAAHHAILDTITNTNMHDLVVYLETVK